MDNEQGSIANDNNSDTTKIFTSELQGNNLNTTIEIHLCINHMNSST